MKKNKNLAFGQVLTFLLILSFLAMNAHSQGLITTTTTLSRNATSGVGRDYWLTLAQNGDNQAGKYYELFVTSQQATTVNIAITGGSNSRYPIAAGQALNFFVPLALEMTTSGVVEDKGIHVWSNDADLSVNLLSRNPASSDGYNAIPTTGWGKEYVVAAYQSLYEGYGVFSDYPSEFCVIADQNNTILSIMPSINIRQTNGGADHKAGILFTDTLQKGQCIQYKAVFAYDCDVDVTGTNIRSNNQIGVIGASQCANIPCDKRFCDHVCDMIPPVRSWGKVYHTIPFIDRKLGDTYVVIGSQAGQNIYRNGNPYVTLTEKYSYYFRPDIADASIWTSNAPFLLAQYINSTEWETTQPGGNPTPLGDPAMVVINPVEQYTRRVIFQTPNITTNGFSNFANVMVNRDAIKVTTFDGQPIASYKGTTQIQIPNSNYTAFRLSNVKPGTHNVLSDSGVGVYVYGYGTYDSYAWSGNLGVADLSSTDSLPPLVFASGTCLSSHIIIKDNRTGDSKINSIVTDSINNISYTLDPNFVTGAGFDSSFYDVEIIDNTKEAFLSVSAYDVAGNRATSISIYKPQLLKFTSQVVNVGVTDVGTSISLLDTFCNIGVLPFHFTASSLNLVNGSKGFVIDSVGADGDVAVGACRIIKIHFAPKTSTTATDTLKITNPCYAIISTLIGNGGQPDYTLSNGDFKCHEIGTVTKISDVSVTDLSIASTTFDSIFVDDAVHFGFDPTTPLTNRLPFTLQGNASHKIEFSFKPDSAKNYQTLAHFHSLEVGWKTAILTGCGLLPAAVNENGYASTLSKASAEYLSASSLLDKGNDLVLLPAVPNPATSSGRTVRFVYGLRMDSPLDLSIFDVLGNLVATVIHSDLQTAGISEADFSVGANMPSGNYIYRLSGAAKVLSGKLVVNK